MVKRDDYNYQELRRRIGVMEGKQKEMEKENNLLKMMCVSLNRDIHGLQHKINRKKEESGVKPQQPQQSQQSQQKNENNKVKQQNDDNEIEVNITRR